MVETKRIRILCDDPPRARGAYVLYWMQQSQRAAENPALEHAIRLANERDQSVVVGFGLHEGYPEANERAFAFLLEGLADTAEALADRGIRLVLRRGPPDRVALGLAEQASIVVCDRGYLRHQRNWRAEVARRAGRRVIEVEGDVVVPVDEVSGKAEYAARTIRPKIEKRRDEYLTRFRSVAPVKSSMRRRLPSDLDPTRPDAALRALDVDRTVRRVKRFRGGTAEARRHLRSFLQRGLSSYGDGRSDPAHGRVSHLSPYLHFGQISPVEVARRAQAAGEAAEAGLGAFLEELIVRRELAVNFVERVTDYDSFECLPAWAKKTLRAHRADPRSPRYTARQIEAARTHDRYFNAAMTEMKETGYMHNTMRMYWGKKILEWMGAPEQAYRTALRLNNRYFLDGRDPSSYANVGWVFGLHDRPWSERPVFGTVRYMSAGGLERKFDIDAYVKWVGELDGPGG